MLDNNCKFFYIVRLLVYIYEVVKPGTLIFRTYNKHIYGS